MQRTVAFLAVLMGCFMLALAINDDTSILFVRGPLPKTQKISETSFADLLAHTLGLEPINPDQKRHNFPHVDLFDLPRSNLFVSVDGVGSASNFFPNAYKVNVNRNNVVQDSLGYLVTLLTGATVAEHEIFGHSWSVDNQVVEAFSGPAAEPKAVSVSDRLFEASKDSLVVCLSFDKQMAEALAAHRPTASRVFFYSESAQAFVDERNPSSVLLTKQQILEFALTLEDSTLPFPVVAELAAIRLLPTLLASLPRVSTPVYVAVGISSTRQITASSPQLLSSVLSLFQAELTTVDQSLGDRNAMQVALLGSSVAQHTAQTPLAFNSRASREAKEDSTTTYTNDQVNSYQIMLWTALVLALSIIAASWVTCTLDTGTNTILHRLPMPKRNHDM